MGVALLSTLAVCGVRVVDRMRDVRVDGIGVTAPEAVGPAMLPVRGAAWGGVVLLPG